jgi:hypothetical protein
MLVATNVDSRRGRDVANIITFKSGAYTVVGLLAAIAVMIVVSAHQQFIPVLVFIAITGIELATAPKFLPEGLSPNVTMRIDQFAAGALLGCILFFANLLNIFAVIRRFNAMRRRRIPLVLLAIGLVGQTCVAIWILGPGLWQLSPAYAAGFQVPSPLTITIVGAMIVVAAGGFAWRVLARRVECPDSSNSVSVSFHFSWLASLFLGIFAIATLADHIRKSGAFDPRLSWQERLELQLFVPMNALFLAVALGGVFQSWSRWRDRGSPWLKNTLPQVRILPWLVISFAAAVVLFAVGPIIAAAGFSVRFLQLRL